MLNVPRVSKLSGDVPVRLELLAAASTLMQCRGGVVRPPVFRSEPIYAGRVPCGLRVPGS